MDNFNTEGNLVESAAELGRRISVHQTEPTTGDYSDAAPFVILRNADGSDRVEFLRDKKDPPSRMKGTINVNDAPSFVEMVRRYGNRGNTSAAIYGERKPARFVAVLNDHGFPVNADDPTANEVGHRDHRVVYDVSHSPEWDVWNAQNGKTFASNEELALFFEDNAPDVLKPSASHMMEVALNFRVKAGMNFSLAQRLDDGQISLGYVNEVSATAGANKGKPIKIPETFTILIPVFDGFNAPRYAIDARFRYRLREEKLSIWFDLVRPGVVLRTAFEQMFTTIQTETGSTIIHGREV